MNTFSIHKKCVRRCCQQSSLGIVLLLFFPAFDSPWFVRRLRMYGWYLCYCWIHSLCAYNMELQKSRRRNEREQWNQRANESFWSFKALLSVLFHFPLCFFRLSSFWLFVFSFLYFLPSHITLLLTHKWKNGHAHTHTHITFCRHRLLHWQCWVVGGISANPRLTIAMESKSVQTKCDRLKWQYIIAILGPYTWAFFHFLFFSIQGAHTTCFLFPCAAARCVCFCVPSHFFPATNNEQIQPHIGIHTRSESALEWAFVDIFMRRQTHEMNKRMVECGRMKCITKYCRNMKLN